MKRILIMMIAPAMLLAYTASAQSLNMGSKLPMHDAELKSVNGDATSLQQEKTGNGLLVMFSCNTCPYVIKAQDRTKEIMSYADKKGIGMVIVNSNEAQREEADSWEAMTEYAKKQGYKVPYLVDEDSEMANAFGATRTPEVFLFNADGVLVYKGAMEDNPSNPKESKEMYLKSAIDNMLAGKTIDPNSTKSIGCTIKRLQ